jgi:hypothetical protein
MNMGSTLVLGSSDRLPGGLLWQPSPYFASHNLRLPDLGPMWPKFFGNGIALALT